MSCYFQETKHPKTGKMEVAFWIDDHFGQHQYGVKFKDDREVYSALKFKKEDVGEHCDLPDHSTWNDWVTK